jgi:hypothetical protein
MLPKWQTSKNYLAKFGYVTNMKVCSLSRCTSLWFWYKVHQGFPTTLFCKFFSYVVSTSIQNNTFANKIFFSIIVMYLTLHNLAHHKWVHSIINSLKYELAQQENIDVTKFIIFNQKIRYSNWISLVVLSFFF